MGTVLGMAITSKPLLNIEIARTVQRDWVAIKQIRHHYEVAVGSELVCDQLDVVEAMANDICETREL